MRFGAEHRIGLSLLLSFFPERKKSVFNDSSAKRHYVVAPRSGGGRTRSVSERHGEGGTCH